MNKEHKKYLIRLLYLILLICAFVLCILSAPLQKSTVSILDICAKSVIPSLFPFMVISSMLTQSAPFLFSETDKNLPVLGMPSCSLTAVLLGAICGFPTGVITAAGLKNRGLITKEQAERLAMISNNTGPAFIIEVIGGGFWHSRLIGVKLYLIQIISCFILGILYFLLSPKHSQIRILSKKTSPEITVSDIAVYFCEAISSAASGVIRICGYIVFFTVVLKSISLVFPFMSVQFNAIISSFLEFTSGCRICASVGTRKTLALSAFSIGFSGLSVFAQSMSFTSRAGFSLKKTFVFKFFQGLLCAVSAYFLI